MVRKSVAVEEADDTMDTSTVASTTRVPVTDKDEYAALSALVNPIAQPLAGRKLAKKIYKLIKTASKEKNSTRVGLADVSKGLRREEKGLMILAGNVWPIDMYSHIPGICEERDLPYVYIPSREHLGLALGYNRPCIVVLVKENESYADLYNEIAEAAKELDQVVAV